MKKRMGRLDYHKESGVKLQDSAAVHRMFHNEMHAARIFPILVSDRRGVSVKIGVLQGLHHVINLGTEREVCCQLLLGLPNSSCFL